MKYKPVLNLTSPRPLGECLEEPLTNIGWSGKFFVAYLTLEGHYLADVNDNPDLEEAYDAGLTIWVTTIQNIFQGLGAWSGGKPSQMEWLKPSRLRIWGRREEGWKVSMVDSIPAEMILSMTTFGWPPIVWTALSEEYVTNNGDIVISSRELESAIQRQNNWWWMTHGYKEPFLVLNTASGVVQLESILRSCLEIPIQIDQDGSFIPHRVRMHQSYS